MPGEFLLQALQSYGLGYDCGFRHHQCVQRGKAAEGVPEDLPGRRYQPVCRPLSPVDDRSGY